MARKSFFSFHYERDAWRAGQVRNCNLLATDDQYGFIDAADWESIERQGDAAIERWINAQLKDTSVTVVLIGAETASRRWVRYEILQSWKRGNKLVGVQIHGIKDQKRHVDDPGANPFDGFKFVSSSRLLSSACRTYDWTLDDGRNNLGRWIEEAFDIHAQNGSRLEITEVTQQLVYSAAASASVGFRPKAPWCSDDPNRK